MFKSIIKQMVSRSTTPIILIAPVKKRYYWRRDMSLSHTPCRSTVRTNRLSVIFNTLLSILKELSF